MYLAHHWFGFLAVARAAKRPQYRRVSLPRMLRCRARRRTPSSVALARRYRSSIDERNLARRFGTTPAGQLADYDSMRGRGTLQGNV